MFQGIVDALINWPEIFTMPNCTTEETINEVSILFGRFGVPTILVTDDDKQFSLNFFK